MTWVDVDNKQVDQEELEQGHVQEQQECVLEQVELVLEHLEHVPESELKSSEEVVGGTEFGLEDCSGVNSWKVVRLELNLPLSLESSTHVDVHVKMNTNRANNCPLLQNVYPVGPL